MTEKKKPSLSWNIELNFNLHEPKPETKPEEPVQAPQIPPRQLIGEKFPKILQRIELLWGSVELHRYLYDTLFTDREKRQGFPHDVLKALAEIHTEHTRFLKERKLINDDVWDMQPKNRISP